MEHRESDSGTRERETTAEVGFRGELGKRYEAFSGQEILLTVGAHRFNMEAEFVNI